MRSPECMQSSGSGFRSCSPIPGLHLIICSKQEHHLSLYAQLTASHWVWQNQDAPSWWLHLHELEMSCYFLSRKHWHKSIQGRTLSPKMEEKM